MKTNKYAIVWGLVLIMMAAGSADAVRKGRLVGRILDPEEKPIEGVSVTVTSPNIEDFREVEITDKKGVFKIDFEEIGVVYVYLFEKAGFSTMKSEQTWRKDGTARIDFTMHPGEASAAGAGVPTSTSQPAVLAFNEGLAAYKQQDISTAAAKFAEAVNHDPGLRQAWGALSVAYLQQKKYQEAADAAERAIELGSTDVAVLQSRWEAYRNLGDDAKAAQAQVDLEKTGRLAEEAKKVYNEGVVLLKAGDEEGAYAKFREAAEFDANLHVAQMAVATTALKVGHFAEAAAAAQAILDENPQDVNAIRIRYNACLALEDDEKLIEALIGLAALEPVLARDGLWRLALESYDAGDMANSEVRFQKVLEVDPNHPWANYLLGLVLMGEGDNETAIPYLERFVELAPDDPEAPSAKDLIEYLRTN